MGSEKVRNGERGINPETLEALRISIAHLIILLRVTPAKRTLFYQHLSLKKERFFSSFTRPLVARQTERERERAQIYMHSSTVISVKLTNKNFFLSRKPALFMH